jgi:DNA-binding transcriptional LysR family regulator
MPDDLEIRLLRYFVTVAEELHFSRAAQRLFVAQQALSRDIRRLEDRLGVRLLDRTTRRVTLTPAGGTLLTRARELLAHFDATVRELRGERRSLTVDVVGPGLTPTLILTAARQRAPDVEFFARFHTGSEAAVPLLLAGRLDVTFGRNPAPSDRLRQRTVRREPLGVLVPERHHSPSSTRCRSRPSAAPGYASAPATTPHPDGTTRSCSCSHRSESTRQRHTRTSKVPTKWRSTSTTAMPRSSP